MFSKKQKVLCKQTTNLSVLCGIKFTILIFSITGEPFIFGKSDAESVVDRFLQAKKATECSSSCRTTVEKICEHKRHARMDQKKKVTIDDKGKERQLKRTLSVLHGKKIEGTDSERLEEQLSQQIENFERDLIKEINKLKSKISVKDTESALKRISSTTPSNWREKGKKRWFRLAKARERKGRDLDQVKCIKGEDGRVLVEDGHIKKRWQSYFHKLLNDEGDRVVVFRELEHSEECRDFSYCRRFKVEEIREAVNCSQDVKG
ncbi:hypothetical protein T459_33855 [Capsicum annuum]|uniref:MADS-box domain-containing protein n=1 Tax=Capsicum annuum TaxID=4072 RepID=A0A2G2XY71_CAPAN|nr:hypothetical protein T459_33855 [Capsicum annuum]